MSATFAVAALTGFGIEDGAAGMAEEAVSEACANQPLTWPTTSSRKGICCATESAGRARSTEEARMLCFVYGVVGGLSSRLWCCGGGDGFDGRDNWRKGSNDGTVQRSKAWAKELYYR